MKALITTTLAAVLAGCGAVAHKAPAASGPESTRSSMHGNMAGRPGAGMGMGQRMQAMDTNGDGMLSKAEFLKAHEAMFDRMKKNEQGEVPLASIGSMGGMGSTASMEMCPMMRRP